MANQPDTQYQESRLRRSLHMLAKRLSIGIFRESPASDGPTQPSTQDQENWLRKQLPMWAKQLPIFPFPEEPNPDFELIPADKLKALLQDTPEDVRQEIEADIEFMDYELLRLFRKRDHEAKKQQIRYLRFQIGYLVLAAIATLIGSFQALAFASSQETMPLWAFGETLVALAATFLATISGRQSPLATWSNNRLRSESMRREYFRYLMRVPPYHQGKDFQKKMLLSLRAADLNRGVDPREELPGD